VPARQSTDKLEIHSFYALLTCRFQNRQYLDHVKVKQHTIRIQFTCPLSFVTNACSFKVHGMGEKLKLKEIAVHASYFSGNPIIAVIIK
jgi:hypothetical protein